MTTVYLQPGEDADLLVNWNQDVVVTGAPRIRIVVGTMTRYAVYAPTASTATQSVFRYTVQEDERDSNGISVYSPIDLDGGVIQDVSGNAANLKLYSIASMTGLGVGCSLEPTARVKNGYTTLRTRNVAVPAGCSTIYVKPWGAGGGASYNSDGGGGFVSGLIDVSGVTTVTAVLGVRGSVSSRTSNTRRPGYDGRTGGWAHRYGGQGAGAAALLIDGDLVAIVGDGAAAAPAASTPSTGSARRASTWRRAAAATRTAARAPTTTRPARAPRRAAYAGTSAVDGDGG